MTMAICRKARLLTRKNSTGTSLWTMQVDYLARQNPNNRTATLLNALERTSPIVLILETQAPRHPTDVFPPAILLEVTRRFPGGFGASVQVECIQLEIFRATCKSKDPRGNYSHVPLFPGALPHPITEKPARATNIFLRQLDLRQFSSQTRSGEAECHKSMDQSRTISPHKKVKSLRHGKRNAMRCNVYF